MPTSGKETLMKSKRYERGRKLLSQIDPAQPDRLIDALKDIAPEFAELTVEFAFGDIYSRQELDLKTRQICTVAALTALGTAGPQLKGHVGNALNLGWTPREIVELIMQMAVYAGFPAALNALFIAKEVFDERNLSAVD